ncbi:MAG TPA: lysophospholipid acyltransferase family protein [Lacibacter sp.]|nr:lysophospholipid acyltransferase family protein [Lacibacter sp.]HMO89131.1 lysophospholipid acyltransferase family protein [Lacibacter sp.]
MKPVVKSFQFVFALYAMILFVLIMFVLVPFVVVASFFGKYRGGNAVMRLAHLWADVWLFLIGIWHLRIVEQEPAAGQSYIFISNHNSYMDIPQLLKAIRRPLRVLGKAEMGKVPVFGLIYNAAVVPVARGSAEARARSLQILKNVLNRGISIFIAPEGTFNMSSQPLGHFYDGAFKLAIETQTPIKPLLFLDAVDRMHWRSIFALSPGRLRTVYLEEVSPEGYSPYQVEELKQKVWCLMEAKLLEYQASWIALPGRTS